MRKQFFCEQSQSFSEERNNFVRERKSFVTECNYFGGGRMKKVLQGNTTFLRSQGNAKVLQMNLKFLRANAKFLGECINFARERKRFVNKLNFVLEECKSFCKRSQNFSGVKEMQMFCE